MVDEKDKPMISEESMKELEEVIREQIREAIAWAKTPEGLAYHGIVSGTGEKPKED